MTALKNKYISIAYESGSSFGGSQRLCGSKILADCGCGLIAAVDLLLYLSRNNEEFRAESLSEFSFCEILPKENYNKLIKKMCHSYFPVIPRFGMNGLGLMAGMQMFFKRNSIPLSCYWRLSDKDLWYKVEEMLANDIPVIMSIGPNFPLVWKNQRVALYTKTGDGEYISSSHVKAHFITVTGIDEQWLEISSWGRRYYLNRRMYEEYVSKYSAAFVSNILYIKRN